MKEAVWGDDEEWLETMQLCESIILHAELIKYPFANVPATECSVQGSRNLKAE